jgi:hypothetical protein
VQPIIVSGSRTRRPLERNEHKHEPICISSRPATFTRAIGAVARKRLAVDAKVTMASDAVYPFDFRPTPTGGLGCAT